MALMVAVSFVGICIAAAMVLDFGVARAGRTANKLAADAAVTAGIRSLEAADSTYKSFAAACTALAYLKVNPGLAGISGTWTTGAGTCADVTLQTKTCSADPSTHAAFTGTTAGGRFVVTIKAPYAMTPSDPDKGEGGGCDQLAVTITQRDEPGLGSLATGSDMVTTTRSVARASRSVGADQVAALVILERQCQALEVNGQNAGVDVKGNDKAAGSIHSDSYGASTSTVTCPNFNKKVLHGDHKDAVTARAAPNGGLPGLITVAALNGPPGNPTNAYDSTVNVVAEGGQPTGHALVGRYYADQRFLRPVRDVVIPAARAQWDPLPTKYLTTPPGYTSYPPTTAGSNCPGAGYTPPTPPPTMAANAYFPCPKTKFTAPMPSVVNAIVKGDLEVSGTASLPAAQQIIVNGATSVSGSLSSTATQVAVDGNLAASGTLSLPNASSVVVGGNFNVTGPTTISSTAPSTVTVKGLMTVSTAAGNLNMPMVNRLYIKGLSANTAALDISQMFRMNQGNPASLVCPPPPLSRRATLVIGSGSFRSGAGADIHLCGTAVVMANSATAACAIIESSPNVPPGREPYTNACGGTVNVGSQSVIEWSAPNAIDTPPLAADKDALEDLALWTEASSQSSVGGGVAVTLSGIFFAPNADPFQIGGGGAGNTLNSQVITRRLLVSGGGTLTMQPNPADVVAIPGPTLYELVR